MSPALSQSGQITALVVIGLIGLSVPGVLVLAHDAPVDRNAAKPVPTAQILNLTETPDEQSTPTPTETPPIALSPTPTPTPSPSAEHRTLVVDDTGASPFADCPGAEYVRIQPAVDAATPGDTVRVCSGTYLEHVSVATPNLTIVADGNATVDAGPADAVRITASSVTLRDFKLRTTNRSGVLVETASHVIVQNNTVIDYRETENEFPNINQYNDGIRINRSDRSVVRNNTVIGFDDDGISVGEGTDLTPDSDFPKGNRTNSSAFNRILHNTVTGIPGYTRCGIVADRKAETTVIRNNTATDFQSPTTHPIVIERQLGYSICVFGNQTDVIDNSAMRAGQGVFDVGFGTAVLGNTLVDQTVFGYGKFEGGSRVLDNEIRNSGIRGIQIALSAEDDVDNIQIHRNVILHSGQFGIANGNESMVVDATNNTWNCGGPSGGLEDPYTGRIANGTGEEITAGDEPGVSNVHFDPFRHLAECPDHFSASTPTPTSTATSTRTTTHTVTSTPTPTPTPPFVPGTGTAAPVAGGSGQEDRTSPAADTSGESGETGAGVATPRPTATALDSTPTSTGTVSPTPVIEPGFGVVPWTAGAIILIALVVIRGRRRTHPGDRNE